MLVEEKNVSADVTNKMNQTLAHIAAKVGHREMLKYIVNKHPLLLEVRDCNKTTVLWLAMERKAIDVLDYVHDVYTEGSEGLQMRNFCSIAWHSAIKLRNPFIIRYLIEWLKCINDEINYLGDYGKPPAFAAIETGQINVFKDMIKKTLVDLTAVDAHGSTILFEMVGISDLGLMRFVLDQRKIPIDVNARNVFGDTVLHKAVLLNQSHIVTYLVDEKGATVSVVGGNLMTPLHIAGCKGHDEIYEFLVRRGADIMAVDFEGKTPEQRKEEARLLKTLRVTNEKNASKLAVAST